MGMSQNAARPRIRAHRPIMPVPVMIRRLLPNEQQIWARGEMNSDMPPQVTAERMRQLYLLSPLRKRLA